MFVPLRPKSQREHSSAGLEHLPYKQGVIGSNPIAPTRKRLEKSGLFFISHKRRYN